MREPRLRRLCGVRRGAALACALALLPAALAWGGVTLYQWTDEDGTVRYATDLGRVPRSVRGQVVPIRAEPDHATPPPGEAPLPADSSDLDAKIRELETAIARDEEALKALISTENAEGSDPLLDSEELREIAQRLPALREELRQLKAQRTDPGAP